MAPSDTKSRILDAAQAEFSSLGFDGASIRGIAEKASVQLASVRYHFGSKDDLWRAVFARHAENVTRRRDGFYKKLENHHGTPTAADIAEAMLGPALGVRFGTEGERSFSKLMANTMSNPDERSTRLTRELFDPAVDGIVAHFKEALPGLGDEEAYWGFFLASGCISAIAANGERLARISNGKASADDQTQAFENLITFVAGGIEALEQKSGKRQTEKATSPSPHASVEADKE